MAFIKKKFLLLKIFEKVEKTGIISTKFSFRCTPSVILGLSLSQPGGQTITNTLLRTPLIFKPSDSPASRAQAKARIFCSKLLLLVPDVLFFLAGIAPKRTC